MSLSLPPSFSLSLSHPPFLPPSLPLSLLSQIVSSLKEVCGSGGATSALSGIEAKIKDNTYSVVRGRELFCSVNGSLHHLFRVQWKYMKLLQYMLT